MMRGYQHFLSVSSFRASFLSAVSLASNSAQSTNAISLSLVRFGSMSPADVRGVRIGSRGYSFVGP